MYPLLKSTHSLLAYFVLAFLIWATVNALLGLLQRRDYGLQDFRISLFALIFTHLQVTLGIILYFVTPLFEAWKAGAGVVMKSAPVRKILVEHPFGLLAAVLITLGWVLHKKQIREVGAFKRIFIFYGLGLVLLLGVLPWRSWLSF